MQQTDSLLLARLIGRVATIQRTCLKMAFKESPGIELEWYYFLHTIDERLQIRKTDVISLNLLAEPTTGIDILNRIITAGLLIENIDPADKRARLLHISPKGRTILSKAEKIVNQVAELLYDTTSFGALADQLATIEHTFSRILTEEKPATLAALRKSLQRSRPPTA